jgi:2-phosphosulfolactate phosphatase
MNFDVALLPRDLDPELIRSRSLVVFDVLRATTSMAAALAAGVAEIRVFDRLDAARAAAGGFEGRRLLCGEEACLPPAGFDLGNSPGAFRSASHAGGTLFMCTTNGTRALVAAGQARHLFIGALVNATATAAAVARSEGPVMLVCAGTNGRVAMEDVLGAGAVADVLATRHGYEPESDTARVALRLFRATRHDLRGALAESQGGRNVLGAGLGGDIDYAARLDGLSVAGRVHADELSGRLVVRAYAAD